MKVTSGTPKTRKNISISLVKVGFVFRLEQCLKEPLECDGKGESLSPRIRARVNVMMPKN